MWVKLYTPAGLIIFLKSRVHGHERSATIFEDHRELEPNHKTWQLRCAKDASSGYEGVILVEARVLLWWMTKDGDVKLELTLSYPLLK